MSSSKPTSLRARDLEYRIPSEPAAGKQVIDEVVRLLEQEQWGEHDIFGIHLAVEEAVVNAIKHGNRCDPSKEVHIRCTVRREHFSVEVRDQGDGFRLEDVPDPTCDENLEVPSGRGIMLMRSFMSRVEYLDDGSRVVMEKRRQGE